MTYDSNRYGRNMDGPRNRIYSTRPTKDAVPEDRCRECGEWVRFKPNGHGIVVAVHAQTLERHPCKNP